MKKFMFLAVLASAAMMVACSGNGKIEKGNPKQMDTLSYSLGADLGMNFQAQFSAMGLKFTEIEKGLKDGLTNKADMKSEEALEILNTFFSQTIHERQIEFEQLYKQDSTLVFNPFTSDAECEEISYALGVNVGDNIIESELPLKWYWLLKAFNDAQAEGALQLTQEEAGEYLRHYFMIVRPAEAKERSAKWLAKMEKKRGVKKTESGLLYKVVKKGDMEKAAKNDGDTVKVHYVGKLQDGTVFDASRFENRSKEQQEMIRESNPSMFDEKGNLIEVEEPIEFPLDNVIKGWTEGMKLVGPGGKIILYIPAELAYGARGVGRNIGPNEALEFEVELIEVKPVTVEEPVAEVEATTTEEAPAAK
jgi:FKBP-type peptidyl-prolyl cis-trans isomerase FkpA